MSDRIKRNLWEIARPDSFDAMECFYRVDLYAEKAVFFVYSSIFVKLINIFLANCVHPPPLCDAASRATFTRHPHLSRSTADSKRRQSTHISIRLYRYEPCVDSCHQREAIFPLSNVVSLHLCSSVGVRVFVTKLDFRVIFLRYE